MRVFLDFEASSLNDESYPIEVGWVFEDGRSEAHLIRPAPQWTDWDPGAEAVHRISRSTLEHEGAAHTDVARRLLDALSPHLVYASAPSWDGKWLSVLFRAAGLPRHAMRLRDTEEAFFEGAAEVLRPLVEPAHLDRVAAGVVERVLSARADRAPAHRAREDAEQERRTWLEVRRLAQEAARTAGADGRT
jgi:hypothetical protein